MRIMTPPEIGEVVPALVRSCDEVLVAVAYFNKTPALEQALATVGRRKNGHVRILVSSEWERSSPAVLEGLFRPPQVEIRQINHARKGRLHAKAFVGFKGGKPRFAVIGSANASWPAFSTSRELCILFDLEKEGVWVRKIRKTLEAWFSCGEEIDWKAAHEIKANAAHNRTGWPSGPAPDDDRQCNPETGGRGPRLWIMKMWDSKSSVRMKPWTAALHDRDLILGWGVGGEEELSRVRSGGLPKHNQSYWKHHRGGLAMIRQFWSDIRIGDRVLILDGWTSSRKGTVQIRGWAQVQDHARTAEKPPWTDSESTGWCYRRKAEIHEMNTSMPVTRLRKLLNKRSCLNTLHHAHDVDLVSVAKALGIKQP